MSFSVRDCYKVVHGERFNQNLFMWKNFGEPKFMKGLRYTCSIS